MIDFLKFISFLIYLPFGLLVEFIGLCKHIKKWYYKGLDIGKNFINNNPNINIGSGFKSLKEEIDKKYGKT